MKTDRYTKLVLSVIALALAVIAMRPVLSPTYSHAARSIEYKIVDLSEGPTEKQEAKFSAMGKQGWDLAAVAHAAAIMKR